MAPDHPDRTFWKDEAEAIGSLTTTDHKQDAIQNERAVSSEEQGPKVAAPFEEKTDEEKKLVRKIDMYLMPTIWVLYCFSYMDRTAIGNAKVAGMDRDLGLTSNEYFLAIVIFQIGYVFFEVPSNMVLSRVRPSIWVPTLMVFWGTVSALMALVKTPSQLIAVRFVLGVTEAGFSPAVLFIISNWYRRHEQSKRFMCFLSAGILSGAFGGIIAGAIVDSLDGAHGVSGWQWLFIVQGVATIGAAVPAPFLLLDWPSSARQLTPREREIAAARLRADGMHVAGSGEGEKSISHLKALTNAIRNWRLWVLCAGYMTIIGCYSLSYFNPTLVRGLGYTGSMAQYMTVPLYVSAFVIAVPVAIFADRIYAYRPILCAGAMVLGALFCALSAGIYAYIPRYVFLVFINSMIWTANPLALSYASVSMGPLDPETRAISLAFVNGMGNLAQIYGSYLFPAEDAPKYLKGFGVYAGLLAFGGGIYVAAFFLFRRSPFKSKLHST
ncbi:MFS general substrate transporter [Setomelanomma holmii]|uniref:MFS general substrate transporter n=1 Tax=Setomelanomma holmii TaxID=210430 RepID=A0A9P4LMY5_9PLEO|nr:MFS general substrate transporter [Setomelanomma holmii]